MNGNQRTQITAPPDLNQLAGDLIRTYTDEKLKAAESAAMLADRWDWVHFFRAFAFQHREQLESAIAEYLEALRVKPDFTGVYNNMGNCFFGLEKYQDALEWYDQYIKFSFLGPQGIGYTNRARVLHAMGKTEAAITNLKIAIEAEPSFERAYRDLIAVAIGLRDARRFDEAISLYEKAFASKEGLQRELALALSQFATPLSDEGRYAEAEVYLDRALGLAGDEPGVMINAGYVRHKANRLAEAVEFYNKALRDPGTKAGAHYNLAGVAARMGNIAEALIHLETAISLHERFRERARRDDDFDSIRNDPAFRRLVGDTGEAGLSGGATKA